MKFKRYSKAIYRGEDITFSSGELHRNGRYSGSYLVFEDLPNALGAVLFSVTAGKISGQSMKGHWEFRKEWEVPNDSF